MNPDWCGSNRPRRATWVGALFTLAIGCSSESDIATVSGRVTINGAPLVDASVIFQPRAKSDNDGAAGMGSYGRTDGDGRYWLQTVDDDAPGAMVGPHKVLISTEGGGEASSADGNRRPGRETVPLRYRDGSLLFDVPQSGTDEANFDLTSDPR